MPVQKETACKATAYKNIQYIIDPGKTVDDNWVKWVETQNMRTDGNGTVEEFVKEFQEVNKQFWKNFGYGDRKYYHIVINFKNCPGVTPHMVMEVGKAYVKYYYPNHQAVMVVHLHGGRKNLTAEESVFEGPSDDGFHFHACVNSVDMLTGKKVDRSHEELAERKDKVNELAYNMFGIEPFDWRGAVEEARRREREEEKTGQEDKYSQVEKDMHEDGRLSELDDLRMKILRNALVAMSREDFEKRMKEDGVTMSRNTEKTVSFTYKDGKFGTVRGSRLGDRYTAEFIDRMIEYNRYVGSSTRDSETYMPLINFDYVEKIAEKKDRILARAYGITIPAISCNQYSYAEMRIRVAFEFVRRQNEIGIGLKDGALYFAGAPVCTDKRLQRMYDAGCAAKECMERYGCDHIGDLEKKRKALSGQIEEVQVELRKERKIETAYKSRLSKKKELVAALQMILSDSGTTEERNQSLHCLYRHGIDSAMHDATEAMERLQSEVKKAEDALKQQSQKAKAAYYLQQDLRRSIDQIEKVIVGLEETSAQRFYYGNDPNWHSAIAQEINAWKKEKKIEIEKQEEIGLDALLAEANERAQLLEEQKAVGKEKYGGSKEGRT